MSPLRRRITLAAVAALLVTPAVAAAAPSAAPDAEAVALFDEGRKLMAAKKYDAAIARFEESLRHARTVGALLNLGRCYEDSGRAASAWATYRAAGALAREMHDPREADADRFADGVRPRVSTLAIDARAAATVDGLAIRRDGVSVSPSSWGDAAPVDAGDHVIDATAPGKRAWRGKVHVGPDGATATLVVPALEDAPAPPPPAADSAVDAAASPGPAPAAPSSGRTAGWIALGLGAAGVGVGSVAGLVALAKHHDATAACPSYPDHCPSSGAADAPNGSSQTWATVSTLGFAAGGAALATGIVLLLASKSPSPTAARVTPIVTARGAGVGLGAAW